ncbi:MAG: TRZ/ATZ family hydrolase [Gammaproteobacteria bacterium]|nr:TRZ/ATZ family hydrolase [Gammaproteobacteria bacterium]
MTKIDRLIIASWIVTADNDNRVLTDHCIAVNNGRIVDLVPRDEATTRFTAGEIVDRTGYALIPGLINAHTHASMTLFRGLADDLALMDWLQNHIWPAEARWVSPAFVRDGAELAVAEMLRSGTTCFCDMYFFPEDVAHIALNTGIRAVIGMIMIDFPSAYAQTADEYLSKGLSLHDDLRASELVKTAFAPHAPYTVSDAPLGRIAMYADELDIPVTMHVHETAHEVEEAQNQVGKRPIQRLQEIGLLNPRLNAVHMTQINDDEISLLADSGVHVVHCPESNLKLASGFCPVQKLLDAGVNVALGTDGAASNNDLDMLAEMRTAALLAKGVAGNPSAVPAMTALRMATINGAKALGLEEETGSLEQGKAADIVAVRLDTLETQPVYDPVSQIVYSAGREHVADVWVAGEHLLKEGKLTTLNETELLNKARHWRGKIAETPSSE